MEILKKETQLPILKFRDQIIETISANPVTIICGETGCGKTTQVPKYIIQFDPLAKVIVTQPRRIAAVSVAQRVSSELGTKLGSLVGYHIGMDCRTTNGTRISYVTTGILLEMLTNNPKFLSSYTHIIFDEVHERGIQCDFSLIAMKLNICMKTKGNPKIIVMSATLNSSLFSEFFARTEKGEFIKATININCKEKQQRRGDRRRQDTSDEEIQYLSEIKLGSNDKKAPCVILPPLRKFLITIKYIDQIQENSSCSGSTPFFDESKVKLALKLCEQNIPFGDILIFVPGMREIKMMSNALLSAKVKCKLFELHSQFNNYISELFAQSQDPKIIVSTNIAESSITLPDVKTIIDFCMTKQHRYDQKTNFQRLELTWASKASMTQRAGRVGRVSDGKVFRLILKDQFQKAQEYDLSEMKRSSLQKTILRIKKLDSLRPKQQLPVFKDVYEVLSNAFETPQISQINKTLQKLIYQQAFWIDPEFKVNSSGPKYFGADIRITELGKYIVQMPCGIHLAKMLIVAASLGIHEQLIDIAAIMSYKKPFFVAYEKRQIPEYHLDNMIQYDQGAFNDFTIKQRIFVKWLQKFFFPWKANNYKKFQVKKQSEDQTKEQQEYYNQEYKNCLIDNSKLVNSFISQNIDKEQIGWCTKMCVWSNNFRDILSLRQSISNKIKKHLVINYQEKSYSYEIQNILIMICLYIGFKNNLIEIQLERKSTFKLKQQDRKLPQTLILPNVKFTQKDLENFIKPSLNAYLQIIRKNTSLVVTGSLKYLSKLRLPFRYRKPILQNSVSQVFKYLTTNQPIYQFSFNLREKRHSRQIFVDDESINRSQFYSGTTQGYLLTNEFMQTNRGLLVKNTLWISSEQVTLLLLIFSKSVKFIWNKTEQFFTHILADGTKYFLAIYFTNQILQIVQKVRKCIKNIYEVNSPQSKKQKLDYQYLVATLVFLLNECNLIQETPKYEDWQDLYAEEKGFTSRAEKLTQQIDHINQIPIVPDLYYSKYRKWKYQILKQHQAKLVQYRYNYCIFVCKQCLPQITIVCTMDNINKTQKTFVEKESTSQWILRDKNLYCRSKVGHYLGQMEDEKPIIDCQRYLVLRFPSNQQRGVSLQEIDFQQLNKKEQQQKKWIKDKQMQDIQYQCKICYQPGYSHFQENYNNFRKHCNKHRDREISFKQNLSF